MALIATQDQTISNWLKMEFGADLAYCRDSVSFTGTAGAVKHGTVLGKLTATGVFVPWDPAASTGAEVASGIVFNAFTATGSAQPVLALVRGPASISKLGVVVPSGTTAPQIAAMRKSLEAIGIQVLETVDTE